MPKRFLVNEIVGMRYLKDGSSQGEKTVEITFHGPKICEFGGLAGVWAGEQSRKQRVN